MCQMKSMLGGINRLDIAKGKKVNKDTATENRAINNIKI